MQRSMAPIAQYSGIQIFDRHPASNKESVATAIAAGEDETDQDPHPQLTHTHKEKRSGPGIIERTASNAKIHALLKDLDYTTQRSAR